MLSTSDRGVEDDRAIPTGSLLEPTEAAEVVEGERRAGYPPRADAVDPAES